VGMGGGGLREELFLTMKYSFFRRHYARRHRSTKVTFRNGIFVCGKHNLYFSTIDGIIFHIINKHILKI